MNRSSKTKLTVSAINKTWIFDLDGTVVRHNGYKTEGHDTLLEGAAVFFNNISKEDMVIFITSRTSEFKVETERFLTQSGIHFDIVVYGAPYGERILINDSKPSGLPTALAVSTVRDVFMEEEFIIDESL